MYNNIEVCNKIGVLTNYFKEFLQLTHNLTMETYLNNTMLKRAVERVMQLIVECATDINIMVLKKIGKGPSKDYYNSFIDLAENNVIDMDFALKIAPSTGLRNILVHEYQKIDDKIVYHSVNSISQYYSKYIDVLSKYLGCR